MYRFEATKLLLTHVRDEVIVSNLGPTSDDLRHAGHRARNFYMLGSMGLCSSIALGMALTVSEKVISLDGDGALLMNLGTIPTIGRERPNNLIVVVWDNEQWAQTGNQASHTAFGTDLEQVARGCGLTQTRTVNRLEELDGVFQQALEDDGPWFIVAKIQEEDYLPGTPKEPELNVYRLRESFNS